MDFTPIVVAFSIGILTIVLALVGVQVIRILGEFKKTFEKMNKILDNVGEMAENAARPTSDVSGVFFGLKTGLKVLKILLKKRKK